MVTLRPIDKDNFWDIVSLEVDDNQRGFVTTNAVSIAQSKVQPECIPLAIYDDDTAVGFVMYCLDADDGEYWIYRLMIDRNRQGKGYAKTAMRQLLTEIARDVTRDRVVLGVHMESIPAVRLYQDLGFRFDGRVFGGEHIMVLEGLHAGL